MGKPIFCFAVPCGWSKSYIHKFIYNSSTLQAGVIDCTHELHFCYWLIELFGVHRSRTLSQTCFISCYSPKYLWNISSRQVHPKWKSFIFLSEHYILLKAFIFFRKMPKNPFSISILFLKYIALILLRMLSIKKYIFKVCFN